MFPYRFYFSYQFKFNSSQNNKYTYNCCHIHPREAFLSASRRVFTLYQYSFKQFAMIIIITIQNKMERLTHVHHKYSNNSDSLAHSHYHFEPIRAHSFELTFDVLQVKPHQDYLHQQQKFFTKSFQKRQEESQLKSDFYGMRQQSKFFVEETFVDASSDNPYYSLETDIPDRPRLDTQE